MLSDNRIVELFGEKGERGLCYTHNRQDIQIVCPFCRETLGGGCMEYISKHRQPTYNERTVLDEAKKHLYDKHPFELDILERSEKL